MARLRLGARLREQDWVAFAIDLAIVIVGVFLGIQASNWNEERKERRTASEYLDRISSDMRDDLTDLRLHEDYWRTSAEAGDQALHYAEDGALDGNQWQTLLDFYHAGEIWNFAERNGTYNEMLSSGRLDLLKDSRLKDELSNYYIARRTQHVLLDSLPAYRDDIRAAVPYRFQRYILDHCEGGPARGAVACAAPADTHELVALNHSLASNLKLIGELRNWMTTLRYTRGVGIDDQRSAARLIGQINAERR